jgi:hypothetical protein
MVQANGSPLLHALLFSQLPSHQLGVHRQKLRPRAHAEVLSAMIEMVRIKALYSLLTFFMRNAGNH